MTEGQKNGGRGGGAGRKGRAKGKHGATTTTTGAPNATTTSACGSTHAAATPAGKPFTGVVTRSVAHRGDTVKRCVGVPFEALQLPPPTHPGKKKRNKKKKKGNGAATATTTATAAAATTTISASNDGAAAAREPQPQPQPVPVASKPAGRTSQKAVHPVKSTAPPLATNPPEATKTKKKMTAASNVDAARLKKTGPSTTANAVPEETVGIASRGKHHEDKGPAFTIKVPVATATKPVAQPPRQETQQLPMVRPTKNIVVLSKSKSPQATTKAANVVKNAMQTKVVRDQGQSPRKKPSAQPLPPPTSTVPPKAVSNSPTADAAQQPPKSQEMSTVPTTKPTKLLKKRALPTPGTTGSSTLKAARTRFKAARIPETEHPVKSSPSASHELKSVTDPQHAAKTSHDTPSKLMSVMATTTSQPASKAKQTSPSGPVPTVDRSVEASIVASPVAVLDQKACSTTTRPEPNQPTLETQEFNAEKKHIPFGQEPQSIKQPSDKPTAAPVRANVKSNQVSTKQHNVASIREEDKSEQDSTEQPSDPATAIVPAPKEMKTIDTAKLVTPTVTICTDHTANKPTFAPSNIAAARKNLDISQSATPKTTVAKTEVVPISTIRSTSSTPAPIAAKSISVTPQLLSKLTTTSKTPMAANGSGSSTAIRLDPTESGSKPCAAAMDTAKSASVVKNSPSVSKDVAATSNTLVKPTQSPTRHQERTAIQAPERVAASIQQQSTHAVAQMDTSTMPLRSLAWSATTEAKSTPLSSNPVSLPENQAATPPTRRSVKRKWENAWGSSFGVLEANGEKTDESVDRSVTSTPVTPLSSWFLSKGPANFKKRVQIPLEHDGMAVTRAMLYGQPDPVRGRDALPAVSATMNQPKIAGTALVSSSPSSFEQFVQDLVKKSAWRAQYCPSVNPSSLMDPPLETVTITRLGGYDANKMAVDSDTPSSTSQITSSSMQHQQLDVVDGAVYPHRRKHTSALAQLEHDIREEKKRARAFDQELLQMLQGPTTITGQPTDTTVHTHT